MMIYTLSIEVNKKVLLLQDLLLTDNF